MEPSVKTQRQEQHHTGVLDVFQVLGESDIFYKCFHKAGVLPAASLACRTFREVLDSSLTTVSLKLPQAVLDEEEPFYRSPLHRWPHCRSLTVRVVEPLLGEEGCQLSEFPQFLLWGVEPAALAKIDTLTIVASIDGNTKPIFPDVVKSLTASLPGLRRLDISGCCSSGLLPPQASGWGQQSGQRLREQLFVALAHSCPLLESLVLPWAACQPGVEALASRSLRQLEIKNGNPPARAHQRPDWSRLFHQLEDLRELCIWKFRDHTLGQGVPAESELLQLLDSLPPWLERMEIRGVVDDMLSLRFKDGGLQSISLNFAEPYDLEVLAGPLRLCKAIAGQRPRLEIKELSHEDVAGSEELELLLAECGQVELGSLTVYPRPDRDGFVGPATQAARLLGLPSVLTLEVSNQPCICMDLRLRTTSPSGGAAGPSAPAAAGRVTPSGGPLKPAASGAATTGGAASRGNSGTRQPTALAAPRLDTATGRDVLRLAAERLWEAAGVRVSEGQAASAAEATGSRDDTGSEQGAARAQLASSSSSSCSSSSSGTDYCNKAASSCMVMLRGVGSSSEAEKLVRELLQARSGAIAPTGSEPGRDTGPDDWFVHLEGTQHVLVECNTAERAAQVAALFATGGSPLAQHGIQAAQLPFRGGDLALAPVIETVLQEMWDTARSSGRSALDRFQRLLSVVHELLVFFKDTYQGNGDSEGDDSENEDD